MSDPVTPATVGIVAAGGSSLFFISDPALNVMVLTALGALIGTFQSVVKAETNGKMIAVFWFVLRWVSTAVVLAGAATYIIESFTNIPARKWPAAVGFAITFFANQWQPWLSALADIFLKNKNQNQGGQP